MKQGLVWLVLVTFLLPGIALAQRGVPITEKPRPDYDALGVRAGAFTIKPAITIGTEYNDNIYAVKNNSDSDWIFTVAPEVGAASNWSRHSLGFNVGLKGGMYASESDENYLDGHAIIDGRLDVTRDSFLIGRAGFERLHEERGDPDVLLSWDEPAVYHQSTGSFSYYQALGRFSVTTGAGITNFDYKRVDLTDGTSQSMDIRNRNIYNVNARLTSEINPDVKPFLISRYEWRKYDESEAERDSDGYRVGVGTGLDFGGVTSAEIYAGYMNQDFDDRKDVSGFWYGMSVLWNATRLTSVQAAAETSVRETIYPDAAGIQGFDAQLRADHELRRNLLIGAVGEYTYDDYKGVNVSDKYYIVGPSITYLWNRNLSAEIGYRHRIKDSNISQREYTENRFTLTLTGSF